MSATVQENEARAEESAAEAAAALLRADEELRKEALASLKRKRKLMENLLTYVTVNGVLWLVWALTDRSVDGGLPWPAWVSSIWGFVLAMEAWRAFGPWPRLLHRPITEADVEREMRRARGS